MQCSYLLYGLLTVVGLTIGQEEYVNDGIGLKPKRYMIYSSEPNVVSIHFSGEWNFLIDCSGKLGYYFNEFIQEIQDRLYLLETCRGFL